MSFDLPSSSPEPVVFPLLDRTIEGEMDKGKSLEYRCNGRWAGNYFAVTAMEG